MGLRDKAIMDKEEKLAKRAADLKEIEANHKKLVADYVIYIQKRDETILQLDERN